MKRPSKNHEIRAAANTAGVRLWQIANALGISEYAFTRRLRFEIPQADQEKILHIIEELKAEQEAGE